MCEVRPDDDSEGQGVLALSKDESPSTNAPQTFGAYRVLHQAGSGILGPVFRALDPQHDRIAAVKVFHLDITPEDAARVADRLRRLATLPPMVGQPRLFDAGAEGSRPFLAMAFHGGETLDVHLRRGAPRPLEEVLPLLLSLSQAIDRASQAGVHHGALHPRDIIQDPITPRVWITGFGVRQALQSSGIALPAARRGYLAPEVATRCWDGRADVFSLGAIVHEWLTRKRPAIGGDQDGTLAGDLSPEQRVELRRVLRRALATDPEARFASAADFVTALQAIVGSELRAEDFSEAQFAEPTARFDPPADAPPVMPAEPSPIATRSPGATQVDSLAPGWDLAHGSALALRRPLDMAAATVPAVARLSRPPRRWGAFPWIAAALGGVAVGIGAGALAAGWRDEVRRTRVDAIVPRSSTNAVVVRPNSERAAGTARPERQVVDEDAVSVSVRRGQLTVRSEPAGAMVTVDGRILGETPLVASDITLGAHDVVVARPGHVPRSERVVLLAASPRRTLTVALESGVDVPPTHGTVDIASNPRGARVFVDGRLIGRTPLRAPELAPGVRRVTFELDGYVTMTTPVSVSRGGTHAIRVTMEASE